MIRKNVTKEKGIEITSERYDFMSRLMIVDMLLDEMREFAETQMEHKRDSTAFDIVCNVQEDIQSLEFFIENTLEDEEANHYESDYLDGSSSV